MPRSSPSPRRRLTRATPLGVFLIATLALAGWLGYQAVDAAASHRRTAEAVLRDYAGISAVEFARIARDDLDDVLEEVFDPVVRRTRSRGAPPPSAVLREMDDAARDQGCECPELRSPLFAFRVDAPGAGRPARVLVEPDTMSARVRGRLAELVGDESPGPGRARERLFIMTAGEFAEEDVAVGYVISEEEDGTHDPIFGFVVSTEALGELFQRWYDDNRLLPAPIAEDEPNDSLLYVTVDAPEGVRVFASPTPYPTNLGATASIGPEYGNLVIRASVRPDAAPRLIIGGLPNARLPLLIILVLLTLALGIAAFVQLRRERVFQRLREDFVSGVSHELRTPLAQIRMFSELQEAGKLQSPEDQKRAVSVIAREARRLSHLVDNILQFSRLRRTQGRGMPRDRIDLGEAIAEGVDSVTPLLQDGGMALDIEVEPGLWVLANRDAVTRVMVNLLDNAIKYGPPGQTVRVGLTRVNGAAQLSVSDQGPGVPPAERNRIWRAYRRLDRDVKARVPGSGIGLSVVSELVELHGGRVWVADEENGGARFVFELPIVREGSSPVPEDDSGRDAPSPAEVGSR